MRLVGYSLRLVGLCLVYS